jgi:hypothetical protein
MSKRILMFSLVLLIGLTSYVTDGEAQSTTLWVAGPVASRNTYEEVVGDHPHLGQMVEEEGFNSLGARDQQDLIRLIEKYTHSLEKAEYYEVESPSKSIAFSQDAESLMKEIKARFGHILKK